MRHAPLGKTLHARVWLLQMHRRHGKRTSTDTDTQLVIPAIRDGWESGRERVVRSLKDGTCCRQDAPGHGRWLTIDDTQLWHSHGAWLKLRFEPPLRSLRALVEAMRHCDAPSLHSTYQNHI